jgi:UDP-glucuronate 4-epimerase
MADRVLVSGAAGFIGSHLCDALLADGCEVVGIDCFTDYYDRARKEANIAGALAHPRFTFVEGDLVTIDLVALLRDIDIIYHLAGQPGVRGSWGQKFEHYLRNNVLATQRLLEAALMVGGRPIVYASSSSVYGNLAQMPLREDMAPAPVSPYGVTKLAGEHLCRLYSAVHHIPTVSLRLFTVYGPRQRPDMAFQRFLEALRRGRPIAVYGDGNQTRDFTYVADVVRAFMSATRLCDVDGDGQDRSGAVMNIAGGARISVREVLALMAEITGYQPQVQYLPAQAGDVRDTWADTTLARGSLGFAPVVGIREGLSRHWRYVKDGRL